jgi:hypothetical protein
MADVIQKIFEGDPITNGGVVVLTGRNPVGQSFRPYQSDTKDRTNNFESGHILEAEPNLTDVENKLTNRFDDPSYYG